MITQDREYHRRVRAEAEEVTIGTRIMSLSIANQIAVAGH